MREYFQICSFKTLCTVMSDISQSFGGIALNADGPH